MAVIAAVAAVASVGVDIWAVGKGKGEVAKGKEEGKGLKEFWSKMPYVIILLIIIIAGIILVAQPKFLFGGGGG